MKTDSEPRRQKARVVIIGGGFGGLATAKALASTDVQVTLVDRRNHHLFQPLLYQVATAALSPAQIAMPIRSVFRRQNNVEVMLGDVTSIDVAKRLVSVAPILDISGGPGAGPPPEPTVLPYDYLVVAAGARHAYLGHDEWEPLAPGLKTLEEATEIRRRILAAYEAAERETDSGRRQALLSFVVIGGGPTGAETAGAISELGRQSMARDFRHIDPRQARVFLIEAGPHILATFDESLSEYAAAKLDRLGVKVLQATRVTGVDGEGVDFTMADGLQGRINARTVVWAAGVQASPLGAMLGASVDRAGRVTVEPDCSIPGHPELFVIGDMAAYKGAEGKMLPGVAPVAMQQGRFVADQIGRSLHGQAREAFHYFDKGSMATIGRAAAITQVGKLKLRGFIAWLAWLFIHIMYLIGFRNRIAVIFDWAWAYLTFQRGARLIVGPGREATAARAVAPSPQPAGATVKRGDGVKATPAESGHPPATA
jgi:NADH dehydrogenase